MSTIDKSIIKSVRNIAFEGGGIKCLAYIGALKALKTQINLDQIENVSGTSSGSIIALLLALNYSIEEIEYFALETDLCKIIEFDKSLIKMPYNFLFKYGVCDGKNLQNILKSVLQSKNINPNITFLEFYNLKQTKNLYITGTNINKARTEFFSHKTTPNMSVLDAIKISSAIPIVFFAQKIGLDYYCDGGMLNNYPIRVFDNISEFPGAFTEICERNINLQSLGFRIDTSEEIKHSIEINTSNVYNYAVSLFNLLYDKLQLSSLDDSDWKRTIRIQIDNISAIDFKLSKSERQNIINMGYQSTYNQIT